MNTVSTILEFTTADADFTVEAEVSIELGAPAKIYGRREDNAPAEPHDFKWTFETVRVCTADDDIFIPLEALNKAERAALNKAVVEWEDNFDENELDPF